MLLPWTSICLNNQLENPEYPQFWYHRWDRKSSYTNPTTYRVGKEDYFCYDCGNEVLEEDHGGLV